MFEKFKTIRSGHNNVTDRRLMTYHKIQPSHQAGGNFNWHVTGDVIE